MGPSRGMQRYCAVPVTILINRTCEVNEPPALQKTFAATGAPRRTRLGSYSGWIAFRPRHEESTRNRLLRAIELGLQRIRHREFGNSQTPGRPPFLTCSSSDRPVASQSDAYTALISAVVRGSSSVAFEPIWFIT